MPQNQCSFFTFHPLLDLHLVHSDDAKIVELTDRKILKVNILNTIYPQCKIVRCYHCKKGNWLFY